MGRRAREEGTHAGGTCRVDLVLYISILSTGSLYKKKNR